MSQPNRLARILEGLATQAIWQVLAFLAGTGLFSVGAARLSKAAHIVSTSVNISLVVVGLGAVIWAWGIVPRHTRTYSKSDILGKIIIVPDSVGAMVYMNQYRDAVDFPFFTVRNFSQADIEVGPMDVQVGSSSRIFGMTRAQFNSVKIAKLTGQSQITVAPYSLTPKDMEFIETTCQRPGYLDFILSAMLRVKTPGETFELPFSMTVRAGIHWV